MALGILDYPARRRVSGLGAWVSTIPPECWDQAGFKDCHTKAYAQAQAECKAAGDPGTDDTCVGPAADATTKQNCACKRSTTTTKPAATSKAVSTSTTPSANAFAPPDSSMILGMPAKTVGIIVLGAVGLYLFTNKKKGAKA